MKDILKKKCILSAMLRDDAGAAEWELLPALARSVISLLWGCKGLIQG
jgi:hypothetical protein